jgi:hypothetical protein
LCEMKARCVRADEVIPWMQCGGARAKITTLVASPENAEKCLLSAGVHVHTH